MEQEDLMERLMAQCSAAANPDLQREQAECVAAELVRIRGLDENRALAGEGSPFRAT